MAERRQFNIPPLRILHIFSRLNCGGAEKRTLEVARYIHSHPELRQRIHFDYCVLSGLPGSLDEEARALGGTIHYLPLRRASFAGRFMTLLRTGGYNIVHSHVHRSSGLLVELAGLAGVPGRVVHFRSQSDGKNNVWRWPLRWLLRRSIDHAATRILAVSRSVMEGVWGINWTEDHRCQVIYNGINVDPSSETPDLEDRARLLLTLGLPPDARLIAHVGGYRPPKNHDRLIEIFGHLRRRDQRSHLLLVGDCSNGQERLARQIAARGLADAVHFLGVRDDVPLLLRAVDVMVFPSLWEGLPGAVLESLAVGTPVVASDIPPHREIASLLPGITCVSLNASDECWANCINSLSRPTPEERAAASLRFAQSPFTLDRCVASLVVAWEGSLLSGIARTVEEKATTGRTFSQRRAA